MLRIRTGTRSRGNPTLIVGIGILAMLLGLYFVYDAYTFVSNGKTTVGKITQITSRQSRCGGKGKRRSSYPCIVYDGQVAFPTVPGSIGTMVVNAGSHWLGCQNCGPKKKIGDEIPVMYDPKNPSHAKVNSFMSLWGGGVIATLFGAIFGMFGLFFSNMDSRMQEHYPQDED